MLVLGLGCDLGKMSGDSGSDSGGQTTADDSDSGSSPPDTANTLRGRAFLSQAVEGHLLVEGTQVFLRFGDEAGFSLSAGCNQIGADAFEMRGAMLVAPELYSTERGCDAGLHEQDTWLMELFSSSPTLTLQGNDLVVDGSASTITFLDREIADPDQSLVGPLWNVNGLVQGGGVGWGSPDTQPTLQFGADGVLAVVTSCAEGSARFEADDTTLELTTFDVAAVQCPDDEISSMIDEHMRAVLAPGVLTYAIEARRLTLSRGDLGLMLVVAPDPVDAPSCTTLQEEFEAEAEAVRRCSADAECGQVIEGTSCGCTRDWVARNDADLGEFWRLAAAAEDMTCAWAGFGSSCDCPETDGYACVDDACTWNYVAAQ